MKFLLAISVAFLFASCVETAVRPETDPPCDGPSSGPFCLRLMAEGRSVPLHLTSPPGYDWLVIVEAPGLVSVLESDSLLPEPFLDLRNDVNYPTHSEEGLLGLEFDPDFEANGIFYANYTDLAGNTGLSRFRVGPDPRRADRATEERLFSIPRLLGHHNAGKIQFGPGGYMWISTGDGFDSITAQDPTNLRGSIIRIDVNGAHPYGIPRDNPFVSDPEALPEIWMYGLRNPWRFHIDLEEGLAYIPDVGHHRREEINVVPWNSPGTNFGWAVLEGSLCMKEGCSAEGTTLPALEYGHDEGCAIIGGVVYRGQTFSEFYGHYFYADNCGFVRSFRYEDGEVTLERRWWAEWTDELGQIIAIADGPGGELWLTTFEGLVYRFDPMPGDSGS